MSNHRNINPVKTKHIGESLARIEKSAPQEEGRSEKRDDSSNTRAGRLLARFENSTLSEEENSEKGTSTSTTRISKLLASIASSAPPKEHRSEKRYGRSTTHLDALQEKLHAAREAKAKVRKEIMRENTSNARLARRELGIKRLQPMMDFIEEFCTNHPDVLTLTVKKARGQMFKAAEAVIDSSKDPAKHPLNTATNIHRDVQRATQYMAETGKLPSHFKA